MTDIWSQRADEYRTSSTHMQGDDLEALVAMCEPAEGVKALDVATGGGHVARRLREEGCEVVTADPAPGMQPDVVARAEELPLGLGAFRTAIRFPGASHARGVAYASSSPDAVSCTSNTRSVSRNAAFETLFGGRYIER